MCIEIGMAEKGEGVKCDDVELVEKCIEMIWMCKENVKGTSGKIAVSCIVQHTVHVGERQTSHDVGGMGGTVN